ncbi:MAG: hypothetical protein ACJAYU_004978 [Bradymonadia bacterium]
MDCISFPPGRRFNRTLGPIAASEVEGFREKIVVVCRRVSQRESRSTSDVILIVFMRVPAVH